VTYDYQYQDVGVKLNVEPVINLHDEITLKLTLEVSSIGDNVGTAEDPQYSILTRTAESVMTVRAGESVIIGGLISDEERKTVRKVPLLGEIPILGYVFSSYDTDDIQKDILMAITPIMIRSQEIPDASIAQIWSGKEEDISLKGPYEAELDQDKALLDRPREELPMEEEMPPWTGIDTMQDMPPMPEDEQAEMLPPDIGPPEEDFPGPEGPMDMPPIEVPEPEDEPEVMPPFEDEGPPISQPGITEADLPAMAKAGPVNEPAEPDVQEEDSSADSWPNSLPYTIQVSAYLSKTEAEKRVNTLKQMDYDCFTYTGYVPLEDKTFYRVFIGKFKDFKTAIEFCEDLRQMEDFAKDIYVVNRSWAIGG
jgi:general secretion pathway protein D